MESLYEYKYCPVCKQPFLRTARRHRIPYCEFCYSRYSRLRGIFRRAGKTFYMHMMHRPQSGWHMSEAGGL